MLPTVFSPSRRRRQHGGALAFAGLLFVAFARLTPAASAGEEPAASSPAAAQLAQAVVKACGGEHWPAVKVLRFTFQVEQPGQREPLVTARHVWDVAANKDTVTWAGKTVTVDLAAPNTEGDAKAAFQRWTNDSYWLLAPLKLCDPGVHLTGGERKTVDGQEFDVLDVSFGKVGLTSGDHYTYYVDPQTHLPARWDYQPAPDKKISGTWSGWQQIGGLTLSTEHEFGGKRIRLLDLEVEH